MDRDWDLLLHMTERYLRAHSVIQHHNELASNVTKELAMGSCIMERVKRLAGNEIELGIRSNLGQVIYRRTKGTAYGIN